MPKISVGTRVPEFAVPMTGGGTWSLKEASGKKLVIYFYPRDLTSGCTREAQDFRDLHAAFPQAGAQVVGVSREPLAPPDKFAPRESLPFPLLANPDEKVCKLF